MKAPEVAQPDTVSSRSSVTTVRWDEVTQVRLGRARIASQFCSHFHVNQDVTP